MFTGVRNQQFQESNGRQNSSREEFENVKKSHQYFFLNKFIERIVSDYLEVKTENNGYPEFQLDLDEYASNIGNSQFDTQMFDKSNFSLIKKNEKIIEENRETIDLRAQMKYQSCHIPQRRPPQLPKNHPNMEPAGKRKQTPTNFIGNAPGLKQAPQMKKRSYSGSALDSYQSKN